MKNKLKIIKITFFFLLIQTLINCNNNRTVLHLNQIDFNLNKLEETYDTELNFKLKDSIFTADIQNKFSQDFCENPNIDITLKFKNTDIIVPIQVVNSCPYPYHSSRHSIAYVQNKNNDILLEDESLNNNESTSKRLSEIIQKNRFEYNKKHVIIEFNWSQYSDLNNTKKRFKELLNGIYLYKKNLAQIKFRKDIKLCSKTEKDSLNKHTLFTIVILAHNYSKPPPPPPPMNINSVDIIELQE